MNLSHILNPPGSSPDPRSQPRVSSLPPALPAAATVLRLDSPTGPSLTPRGPRKLASPPTSTSLRDNLPPTIDPGAPADTAAPTHSKSTTGKIKPNQVNNGYCTHTFRASRVPPSPKDTKDKLNGTTSAGSAAGPSSGSGTAGAGVISINGSFHMMTKHNTAQEKSSSTTRKRQRNHEDSPSSSPSQESPSHANLQEDHQKRKQPKQEQPSQQQLEDSTKKKPQKGKQSPTRQAETDPQQPREIRFVMTDVDGRDKQPTLKQQQSPETAMTSTTVSTSVLNASTLSHNSQSEKRTTDQGDTSSSQPPSMPDFEKNADGKYRCGWPRCGKEFQIASRLTTHYRIHTGKPPYLCGYKDCQKAFHTSSSLSHHRVVHTDQSLRPYVCNHNRCGATYTQLARLITHQRSTHSGMILFMDPQESSNTTSSSTITSTGSPTAKPESRKVTTPTPKRSKPDSTSISPPSAATRESDLVSPRNGSPSEFSNYTGGNMDNTGGENEDSDEIRQRNEAALTMAMLQHPPPPPSYHGSQAQPPSPSSSSPSPSHYQYPRGDYHNPQVPYSTFGFPYYSKPPPSGSQGLETDDAAGRTSGANYSDLDTNGHPPRAPHPELHSHVQGERYPPGEPSSSHEPMARHSNDRSV
ncbi:hypothetical protein BGX34_006405 [Mortierella sp. NVP85]|nr:hypothetical protein BGX34_006405 [Mortierella sp. NVP85]